MAHLPIALNRALNEIVTRKPDLVVAGINHGGNQGIAVNYSGYARSCHRGYHIHIPLAVSQLGGTQDSDYLELLLLLVCWHAVFP